MSSLLKTAFGKVKAAFIKERAYIPAYVFREGPEPRPVEYDYKALIEKAKTSPILRSIIRAITEVSLAQGWTIVPKFKLKCQRCGTEFDKQIDNCEECNSDLLEGPDELEWRTAERLLTRPNENDSFEEILKSLFFYALTTDDWYISITYDWFKLPTEEWAKKGKEIFVENSAYIKVIANEKGQLGSDEYFCPTHYKPDVYYNLQEAKRMGFQCPECKGPLLQTAYIQEINGQVKARFAKDEIVHGSFTRILPNLYGNSRVTTLMKVIDVLDAMDQFNFEVYTRGHLGSILEFRGFDQVQVNAIREQIESELRRRTEVDITTGKIKPSKAVKTFMLGTKGGEIVRHSVMEDFKYMQSFEFYKLYREIICGLYGVSPIFVSVTERGANPRMQIDVQDRTVRECQRAIEEAFNSKLLPRFGVHDWLFKFRPLQPKDELREMQIKQVEAEIARVYSQLGFEVGFDEFGKLVISKPVKEPVQEIPIKETKRGRPKKAAKLPRKPKESERTGAEIQKPESERSLEER